MTWNLGIFNWLKFAYIFNLKLNGKKIKHEYLQNQQIEAILKNIIKINADFLVLQEFHEEEDRLIMISKLKFLYPYYCIMDSWYREKSILAFSKKELKMNKLGTSNFYILKTMDLNFIPIHTHNLSPKKRLDDTKILLEEIKKSKDKIDCVLGDFNYWCFLKNYFFLFKKDKIGYKLLKEKLIDATDNVALTCKNKTNTDKIFLSKKLNLKKATCLQQNEKYMDHYPVFVDIE